MERDPAEFDLQVRQARALSPPERREILALFETSYARANPRFLERSLETLRNVAVARSAGRMVGFALGETRVMDLPRLPSQLVSLAGLACVAREHRRQRLFASLARLALIAADAPARPRRLFCGRMAHPVAMRGMARLATVVPKPGLPPTPWQQEVGRTIAAAYRVHGFDPETFVCRGSGEPIGYPELEFEAEPEEWKVFRAVDRDRGDALLAIAWVPSGPPGWESADAAC